MTHVGMSPDDVPRMSTSVEDINRTSLFRRIRPKDVPVVKMLVGRPQMLLLKLRWYSGQNQPKSVQLRLVYHTNAHTNRFQTWWRFTLGHKDTIQTPIGSVICTIWRGDFFKLFFHYVSIPFDHYGTAIPSVLGQWPNCLDGKLKEVLKQLGIGGFGPWDPNLGTTDRCTCTKRALF